MKHYKPLIKIALAPYIIMGLVIVNDFLLKIRITHFDRNYVIFVFLFGQLIYLGSGLLLASLHSDHTGIKRLKSTKIILCCNIIVLFAFYGIGYMHILFFVNIKGFVTIDFLVIGYYVYLLIQSFKK